MEAPSQWSLVETSGQLKIKNSSTIYIWCKGYTNRDVSFIEIYFQIRMLK